MIQIITLQIGTETGVPTYANLEYTRIFFSTFELLLPISVEL